MIANAATIDAATFGKVLDPIITNVVNPIVELMFAVALLAFAYGVLQVVMNSADSEAHAKGKASIFWGIVGMFIMFSALGIIHIIAGTVGQF
ncbi:MAG: hypothetical protein KGI49_00990 [Patescibacteria group bacterium]|nr:hypothetical protein [Patescibacteria group bacterium]